MYTSNDMNSGLPTETDRPKRMTRVQLCLLVGLIAIGTCVQVYRAAALPCISRDGVLFVKFAGQLADDSIRYLREQAKQPGYAWMLLAAYTGFGEDIADSRPLAWERCGQLIAIVGGVAVIALLFVLTKSLFDAPTALLAAGLAAVWPQSAMLASDVLSDMPHLAVYLAALCVGVRAVRVAQWPAAALCGVLAGAAFYVRQEALGLPIAVVVCVFLFGSGSPFRRRAIPSIAVLAAFAVTVMPLAIATGTILHNKLDPNLIFAAREAAAPMTRLIRADPVTWWSAPWIMFSAWAASGTYVVSTWVFVAVLWRRVPRGEPAARQLVIAAALLQCLAAQLRGSALGVISDRYMLIPAALSIPWAAAGLRWTLEALFARGQAATPQPRRTAAVYAITLLAVSPMIYRCIRPVPDEAAYMRHAGIWLAARAGPGDRIVGAPQLDRVAFYAGLPLLPPESAKPGMWFADHSDPLRISDSERNSIDALRRRIANQEPATMSTGPDGQYVKLYRLPATIAAGGRLGL